MCPYVSGFAPMGSECLLHDEEGKTNKQKPHRILIVKSYRRKNKECSRVQKIEKKKKKKKKKVFCPFPGADSL